MFLETGFIRNLSIKTTISPNLFSLVNTFKAFYSVYNGLSLSLKLMAVSFAPKLIPPTSSGQQQANVLLVCDRSFIRFLFYNICFCIAPA
jgi:hypothetical protein